MGRYAACKILTELLQDGIIRQSGRKEAGVLPRRFSLSAIVFGPGAYVLLAALIASAIILPTGFPSTVLPIVFRQSHHQRFIDTFIERTHMRRIVFGLEAFYLKNSRYPQSLTEPGLAVFVPGYMFSDAIRYTVDGAYYRLAEEQP
jgi:hypothetical protein